jgi:DNA repair protein RadC
LVLRPQGFFLFHNHPSGVLHPSVEDEDLTDRVAKVCQQLGLQFLGHAILTVSSHRWMVGRCARTA